MNELQNDKLPEIIVFAGPNGSGKSTFTELLKPTMIDYINADEIKKALKLVKDVVAVSDICHIYDNSEEKPFRIFKKKKNQHFYQECEDWFREDIELLTGIKNLEPYHLNLAGE